MAGARPRPRGHARRAGHARPATDGRRPARGRASTPASRTRSCATCASAASRLELHPCTTTRRGAAGARPRRRLPGQRAGRPGGARLRRRHRARAASARCRCGASASATSCCAGRSGSRPSSSRSATAAPTTRSRTWRPARSTSPPRTTASRCSGPDGEQTIDADEPMRWETDFGAAELSQLNLYDRTVEGLVLRDVPGEHGPVPPRGGPGPARRAAPLRPLPGVMGDRLAACHAVPATTCLTQTSRRSWCSASGPIVIGQAAEFDYSGAQACKVLLEEGYEVVLVNSNPATIMTDPEFATATYIEPLLPGLGRARDRARAPRRAAAHARRRHRAQPRPRALPRTARWSATGSS